MTTASRERLNRFLARRGVASRRGADELIAAGRVSVNGAAAVLGTVIDPALDRISVDGEPVEETPAAATVMLNKPAGVVTTVRDTHGRPTVMELVEDVPGLVPVGRLDADTHGLLLLSNDGELVHRLTHPRHQVVKRYRVTVDRPVAAAHLRRLTGGVTLDDGPARALSARRAPTASPHVIDIEMGEGRKREVRRLCAAAGLEVRDLQRTAVGPLRLGTLPEGSWRALSPGERQSLYRAVGMTPP